ncbi:hypothetical protein [Streptomyces sp. NPDC005498]|uniref:hypothetical protein n=1 Tax=Streptomyces sp. NPDC005498 TaxID=3364717 RepID=UPI00368402FD
MARDAGGNVHGYQFKEIQNPKKVVKKIFDNMKQLDESGADFKTFVVDTKGTLADHLALPYTTTPHGRLWEHQRPVHNSRRGRGADHPTQRYVHAGGNTLIATTPVARWTWGRDNQAADKVAACLHELLTAYTVLARHRLASDVPNVSLSVHEAGKSNSYLFQGNFELDATSRSVDIAHQIADQVKNSLRPGTIGAVYAYAKSTGMMPGGNDALHGGELFRLGASAFVDYVSTDLVTFSDLWMPYDLKGRAQPAVHAANAPRLAAALRDLAEALGSETDPDDPTYFGKPTETGIDNYFDDGIASDVWSRFEIPYVSWTLHRIGPGCPPAHGRSTLHELGEPSHSEPPTDTEIMAPTWSGAMAPA